jgi:cation diffusion facilitator family transporter
MPGDLGQLEQRRGTMSLTLKLALGSILVGFAVLTLKYLAYYVTGSIALYSDALESVINVATAIAAFIAIRISLTPADREHPYGHSKAEYLSAVLEGVLIMLAAFSILREAYFGFLNPKPFEAPLQGLALNGAASLINALWSFTLIRSGRRQRSPALVADGRHLLTDVLTSAGVLIGVAIAAFTGWAVLDPAIAALVALNILWMGYGLMKESVGGLMDAAAPPEVQDRIRSLIAEQGSDALQAHDLRTRQAGRVTFIDFHLVVPGNMSVARAHDICDRIEHALKKEMGEAVITIHVEPEHKAKPSGALTL